LLQHEVREHGEDLDLDASPNSSTASRMLGSQPKTVLVRAEPCSRYGAASPSFCASIVVLA
jgi:hypothetical protein